VVHYTYYDVYVKKKMMYIANKCEKSLIELAKLLNIRIFHGWKKELGNKLGVNPLLLTTWIRRNDIPKKRRDQIARDGIPEEKWWTENEPYPETLEHIMALSPEEYHLIEEVREFGDKTIKIFQKIFRITKADPYQLGKFEGYLDNIIEQCIEIKKKKCQR